MKRSSKLGDIAQAFEQSTRSKRVSPPRERRSKSLQTRKVLDQRWEENLKKTQAEQTKRPRAKSEEPVPKKPGRINKSTWESKPTEDSEKPLRLPPPRRKLRDPHTVLCNGKQSSKSDSECSPKSEKKVYTNELSRSNSLEELFNGKLGDEYGKTVSYNTKRERHADREAMLGFAGQKETLKIRHNIILESKQDEKVKVPQLVQNQGEDEPVYIEKQETVLETSTLTYTIVTDAEEHHEPVTNNNNEEGLASCLKRKNKLIMPNPFIQGHSSAPSSPSPSSPMACPFVLSSRRKSEETAVEEDLPMSPPMPECISIQQHRLSLPNTNVSPKEQLGLRRGSAPPKSCLKRPNYDDDNGMHWLDNFTNEVKEVRFSDDITVKMYDRYIQDMNNEELCDDVFEEPANKDTADLKGDEKEAFQSNIEPVNTEDVIPSSISALRRKDSLVKLDTLKPSVEKQDSLLSRDPIVPPKDRKESLSSTDPIPPSIASMRRRDSIALTKVSLAIRTNQSSPESSPSNERRDSIIVTKNKLLINTRTY